MEKVIVTTGDLKERYEVIGPVYYQINNRPMGFSGKSKLSIKESEYLEIAKNNQESSGIGLVSALFMPIMEFGPGDSRFTTARHSNENYVLHLIFESLYDSFIF